MIEKRLMSVLNSSWLLYPVILCIAIIFLGYKYFTRQFDYWKKRGVYTSTPVPFFGSLYDVATFKLTSHELFKKFYDETEEPYFGMFLFDKPILVVKSPKLIKDILIKDFNTFGDRSVAHATHHDNGSQFLFFQKRPSWKYTRGKMSPIFSSTMTKQYFADMELINKRFIEYLENISGPVDAKFIAGHFSTEMVARCFFATDPRCFETKVSEFRQRVHRIFEFGVRNGVIQSFYFFKPSLVKFFKLNFVQNSAMKYFEKVFLKAMEYRKQYNGKPANMVDLVNDLQKKHDRDFPGKY
ncbi:hypothetical protein C4B38_000348 [Diabrotica virgifera virgifera]|uniref:Cytochrome P450 6k1-like n=1 Tax=Diabrotica virgifera virgifera TaxID=50390 RepID=A0A6P7GKR0_DIAVI|nr:hypothetical protein C4B38_000348 [Diabrotica virgifera virgifera]